MKRQREVRIIPLDVELRAGEGEAAGKLVGHAAVFDQWSTISEPWFGDLYEEQVAPGAFSKTIKEGDIRALWNHDPNIVLGRVKAGTLELREDETGLATTITPPDNEWGRPGARRGAARGRERDEHRFPGGEGKMDQPGSQAGTERAAQADDQRGEAVRGIAGDVSRHIRRPTSGRAPRTTEDDSRLLRAFRAPAGRAGATAGG